MSLFWHYLKYKEEERKMSLITLEEMYVKLKDYRNFYIDACELVQKQCDDDFTSVTMHARFGETDKIYEGSFLADRDKVI